MTSSNAAAKPPANAAKCAVAVRRRGTAGARPEERPRRRPRAARAPSPPPCGPAGDGGPAVIPTFEDSMLTQIASAAAAGDATLAAALATAREDPDALAARARADPAIGRALAAFFVREMERDPSTAIELATLVVKVQGVAACRARIGRSSSDEEGSAR